MAELEGGGKKKEAVSTPAFAPLLEESLLSWVPAGGNLGPPEGLPGILST